VLVVLVLMLVVVARTRSVKVLVLLALELLSVVVSVLLPRWLLPALAERAVQAPGHPPPTPTPYTYVVNFANSKAPPETIMHLPTQLVGWTTLLSAAAMSDRPQLDIAGEDKYLLTVNGQEWLADGGRALFIEGRWVGLRLVQSKQVVGTDPILGAWTAAELHWVANNTAYVLVVGGVDRQS
jgi:hypothetical protein